MENTQAVGYFLILINSPYSHVNVILVYINAKKNIIALTFASVLR